MRAVCALAILLGTTAAAASCTVDADVGTLDDGGARADASDDAVAPGSDASTDASADGSAPDAGDGAIPIVDAGCGVTFAQEGSWVDLKVIQQVPPQGLGGDIAAGTYVLSEIDAYLGAPTGTAQIRETLQIAGSPSVGTFAVLGEIRNTSGGWSDMPPTGSSATYQAQVNTHYVFVQPTCGVLTNDTGTYTATPTSFTTYLRNTARIYQRVH